MARLRKMGRPIIIEKRTRLKLINQKLSTSILKLITKSEQSDSRRNSRSSDGVFQKGKTPLEYRLLHHWVNLLHLVLFFSEEFNRIQTGSHSQLTTKWLKEGLQAWNSPSKISVPLHLLKSPKEKPRKFFIFHQYYRFQVGTISLGAFPCS